MYLLDLFIGTTKIQKLWPFCCNIWVYYDTSHTSLTTEIKQVSLPKSIPIAAIPHFSTLFRRLNYHKIWKRCCEWTKNEQSSTRSRVFCSEKSVLFVFLMRKLWSQGSIIFFSNPVSHLTLIICYCFLMFFTTRTDSEQKSTAKERNASLAILGNSGCAGKPDLAIKSNAWCAVCNLSQNMPEKLGKIYSKEVPSMLMM